ncbi:MAG TPA: GntR family transcriptional regulator [Stellaceae bacterium]|nr:GntR family transcriptional regulator [Stellaceae bacterium]
MAQIVDRLPDDGTSHDAGRTLAQQLFQQLGDAIISGDLTPGSKLSEPVLARRYGVSRGPLREALHRLQERRLVTRVPHLGARVAEMSPRLLHEIFIVREALEGVAAREAARQATATDLAALRAAFRRYEADLVGPDALRLYARKSADDDFHFLIAQASRNPTLIALLCDDFYPLLRFYRSQTKDLPGRGARVLIEHRRILEAIEERDPDMAELTMRRHIAGAREMLEAALAQRTAKPAIPNKPSVPKP